MAEAEGIQQELQDYLQRKGINTLFVNIVESLLLTKPDNPIQHIIQYLHNNFPDQCNTTGTTVVPPIATSLAQASASVGGGMTTTAMPTGKSARHSDESESEDEDENENEDQLGEMQQNYQPSGAPIIVAKGRRTSVSAEQSENDNKPMNTPIIPKSETEKQRIEQIIRRNMLFKNLDEKQIEFLVNSFFPKEYKEGDTIIKQGDDGDNFYVLDTGVCEIYVDNELVQTCTESMSFGELALMYNAPRAATVKAKETVKVWALERKTFRYVLMDTATKKRERHQSLVKRVPILDTLSEIERMKVADALRAEVFQDGEIIIHQGDAGNHFYIIDEGTAVCTKQAFPTDPVEEIARLTQGNYFGEIALLTTRPRQATVTAKGLVRCLVLDRRTFKRVMGPLEDILKRNLEQYNLVMANNI